MFIIHWASWLRTVILWLWQILCYYFLGASLVAQMVKISCSAGDPRSNPGLGRPPGEGNGNPFQYSCLENPMDRAAWGLQSMGLQSRREHTHTHTFLRYWFCPIFCLLSHTEAQINCMLILKSLTLFCMFLIYPPWTKLWSSDLSSISLIFSFTCTYSVKTTHQDFYFVYNFHLYYLFTAMSHLKFSSPQRFSSLTYFFKHSSGSCFIV